MNLKPGAEQSATGFFIADFGSALVSLKAAQ
jgi:hypothetical protein